MQGFVLIFVLLLLTLHPKVAFWSTLGVMTAFAGSFFILPYVDVSLNFMSVFGFLLVLGIMVDDAIIVGEAVYERAERGHTGADASILATQMVLKPLVASVFVTMIAFSPMDAARRRRAPVHARHLHRRDVDAGVLADREPDHPAGALGAREEAQSARRRHLARG